MQILYSSVFANPIQIGSIVPTGILTWSLNRDALLPKENVVVSLWSNPAFASLYKRRCRRWIFRRRSFFALRLHATHPPQCKLLLFLFILSVIAIIVIFKLLNIIFFYVFTLAGHFICDNFDWRHRHCAALYALAAQNDSHLKRYWWSFHCRASHQQSVGNVLPPLPLQNELMCKLCTFWGRRSHSRSRHRRRHLSDASIHRLSPCRQRKKWILSDILTEINSLAINLRAR